MGRHGYSEGEADSPEAQWAIIRWRGAVTAAIRGKRGQAFLRELAEAMDAMPEKRLGCGALVGEDGCACALGVVAQARGVDVSRFESGEMDEVYVRERSEELLGIAEAMAAEIMWENDEGHFGVEDREERWMRMRRWVDRQLTAGGE